MAKRRTNDKVAVVLCLRNSIDDYKQEKHHFDHEAIKQGANFEFGDLVLTACFTPGHTPEHMS